MTSCNPQAQQEAAELRLKLKVCEDATSELQTTRARLAAAAKQVKELEWKNEVCLKDCSQVLTPHRH